VLGEEDGHDRPAPWGGLALADIEAATEDGTVDDLFASIEREGLGVTESTMGKGPGDG